MIRSLINNKIVHVFGLPIVIILLLIVLTKSDAFNSYPETLSLGITIDLLIVVPILYLFLVRKKGFPKTTAVFFFVVGLIVASVILPKENHYWLNQAKIWILPIIEFLVLIYLIFKIRQIKVRFKASKELEFDFYSTIKKVSFEFLPKVMAIPFATEISVFYYGFLDWRKRNPGTKDFTYHKSSGTPALLTGLLFLIAIETPVIHLLLTKWSPTIAWIVTAISLYSGIQVLGILKSMSRRYISLVGESLLLRYGIFNESEIKLDTITSIKCTTSSIEEYPEIKKLSPFHEFEGHNVIISLNQKVQLNGFYGIRKSYQKIALYVDKADEFKNAIRTKTSSQIIK